MIRRLLSKIAHGAVRVAPLRECVVRYYDRHDRQHDAWRRPHPIDARYGIVTTGWVPGYALDADARRPSATAYAGSQPSVVRAGLALVEDPENTMLIDIGCGKGRALIVASEFPFRAIVGIERSKTLVRIARKNAASVRRAYPERAPIEVLEEDALAIAFPTAPLAIFMYHPFGEETMRPLVAVLERRIEASDLPMTIVYCNPVCGDLFDGSSAFVRAHAVTIAVDASERAFGPDATESVVVWRDRHHGAAAPSREATRAIVAVDPGWRAELAE